MQYSNYMKQGAGRHRELSGKYGFLEKKYPFLCYFLEVCGLISSFPRAVELKAICEDLE